MSEWRISPFAPYTGPRPWVRSRGEVCTPYYQWVQNTSRPCSAGGVVSCTYTTTIEDFYPSTCSLKYTTSIIYQPGQTEPAVTVSYYQASLDSRWVVDCPPTTVESAPGSSTCVCADPEKTWMEQANGGLGACIPAKDFPFARKPRPKVCPAPTDSAGDPIHPLTGTTTQVLDLGLAIADRPFKLHYDSGQIQLLMGPAGGASWARSTPYSRGWASPLFNRVYLQGENGLRQALVTRADGTILSFSQNGSNWNATSPDRQESLLAVAAGWRLVDPAQGTFEEYGPDGRLQRVAHAGGATISLTYSDSQTPPSVAPGSGYLIHALDERGRALRFTHGVAPATGPQAAIRVLSIADSSGRAINLGYSADGDLSALNWPDGTTKSMTYQAVGTQGGFLTGITNELSQRFLRLGYDASGRAVSTEIGSGQLRYTASYTAAPSLAIQETYDPVHDVSLRSHLWTAPSGVSVSTPTGSVLAMSGQLLDGYPRLTARSQPAGSGCAASSVQAAFDNNGNPTSIVDNNGNRACRSFDPTRGLELTRVEGLADGVACSAIEGSGPLPAGSRRVTTQWHPDWPSKARLAEPGRVTTYVYNGQPDPFAHGAIARCAPASTALPDGKPIAVLCRQVEQATADGDGAQGFSAALQPGVPAREQRWTYNEFGQVLTATDPLGRITNYTYYIDTAFTGNDPTAVGHTRGDLMRVTNAAGHITQYTLYDKLGQLLQSVDPNGVVTTYTYDARQRLTSTTVGGQTTTTSWWPTGLIQRVTAPDGSWTHYEHDDAHRLRRVSDSLGNSVTYTLDGLGNRIAEEVKDPTGALRRTVARSIDALGRVQQLTGRE